MPFGSRGSNPFSPTFVVDDVDFVILAVAIAIALLGLAFAVLAFVNMDLLIRWTLGGDDDDSADDVVA